MDDPTTFSSTPTVLRPVSPGVPPFPALEYDPPAHGHTCVGAPLARLAMQIGLQQVLTRMPDVELTKADAPKHFGGAGTTFREAVPVRFTPGTRIGPANAAEGA